MTGLPQMWNPTKRNPVEQEEVPLEVQVWQWALEDARRMQDAAYLNSGAVRALRPTFAHNHWLSATERHAAEQYAYVRYLMGIDDYWLTLEHRWTAQRPEWARIQHVRAGVATPAGPDALPPSAAPPPVLG